jgi:hypothetical protein
MERASKGWGYWGCRGRRFKLEREKLAPGCQKYLRGLAPLHGKLLTSQRRNSQVVRRAKSTADRPRCKKFIIQSILK